ncbi:hypothetical protein RB653_007644 [Dictyostelium firmibasis]|uniref:Protein kinase domain-containing protein n=1 Tax=Dictyostelium firmibasis TaxID=79012 RepID=A0AAN7YXY8_9MYCE
MNTKFSFNDFEIEKIIKNNSVYKVKNKNRIIINNNQFETCIIKKLKNRDYGIRSCVFKEINILEKLKNNNNVVKCYGWYSDNEYTYLFLEYINGITLDEHILEKKQLSDEEISLICGEILVAIQSIHKIGIIHRDLKPDNIMYSYDTKKWLLIDFGLSYSFTPNAESSKCYSCVGTDGYKPPEILLGKEACRKSDVWSFGCTVIKMLGGKLIDEITDEKDCSNLISNNYYIPSHASKLCQNFIKKCLTEEAVLRFDSQILNSHPFITKYTQTGILVLIEKASKKWIEETQKKKYIDIGDNSFTFQDENNTKVFDFKSVPNETVELRFKKTFNQPIPDGSLPNTVEIIDFGIDGDSEFNQELTESNLPSELKSLTLGNAFTFKLPSLKLVYLSMGKGTMSLKHFPYTLETLKYYGSIQNDLKENNIPNVKTLLIPFNNGPIIDSTIPETVTYLTLGYYKDLETIASFKNLPKSVDDLVFTCSQELFDLLQRKHIPDQISLLVINRVIIELKNNDTSETFLKYNQILNN